MGLAEKIDALNVKTFIGAIRNGQLAFAKVHALSGKFGEKDLQSALALSAICGQEKIAAFLIDRFDFLDLDRALHAACSMGRADGGALLCSRGADAHSEEDFGLLMAAGRGHSKATAWLLAQGPDFRNSEYAFKRAFKKGLKSFALDCLSFQANARTPQEGLAWACRKGRDDFAGGCLLAGANPNADEGGLFLKAVRDGNFALVKALADAGADPLLRGDRVLLDSAKLCKDRETLFLVKKLRDGALSAPSVILAGEKAATQGLKTVQGIVVPSQFA